MRTATGAKMTDGSSRRSFFAARRSAHSRRAGCGGGSGTSRHHVLRRLDADELKRLADAAGFMIEPAEEEQFRVLADSILEILDGLEGQEAVEIRVIDAMRDAGRPPAAGEDPFNAIVRWCSVMAEGAAGPPPRKRVG